LPTLWRVLPAIERLQTAWEAKRDDEKYALYVSALNDGLDKLRKYYTRFDKKPAYILALVLHLYYKLNYIKMAWGGEEEQQQEIAAGNPDAKNWQKEAERIVENTMEAYYRNDPTPAASQASTLCTEPQDGDLPDEYDRHREQLLSRTLRREGWRTELARYLTDIPDDVTKDMDIVAWWGVHSKIYPTLAQIALDVLPAQASSVLCERLFSAGKEVADDRRARLGAGRFEQLQMLKFAWKDSLTDCVGLNSSQTEEVYLEEFERMLAADNEFAAMDSDTETYTTLD
jgi:hypothetical protein